MATKARIHLNQFINSEVWVEKKLGGYLISNRKDMRAPIFIDNYKVYEIEWLDGSTNTTEIMS